MITRQKFIPGTAASGLATSVAPFSLESCSSDSGSGSYDATETRQCLVGLVIAAPLAIGTGLA